MTKPGSEIQNQQWIPTALWSGFILLGFGFFVFWKKNRSPHNNRIWFYNQLMKLLGKTGIKKESSQTLYEYIKSLQDKLGHNSEEAIYLASQYYRLRFNPFATLRSEENQAIQAALTRLKK